MAEERGKRRRGRRRGRPEGHQQARPGPEKVQPEQTGEALRVEPDSLSASAGSIVSTTIAVLLLFAATLAASGGRGGPSKEDNRSFATKCVLVAHRAASAYFGGSIAGQSAAVTVDALPNEIFAGKIYFISPGVVQRRDGNNWRDSTSKKFLVKVDIDKSDRRQRPGMTARIDVLLEKHAGVVRLPLGGLFEDMGEGKVYVKGGAGIEERVVKIGVRNEDQAEVLEGLKAGEMVLMEKPEDGLIVKRAPAKAAKR